MKKKYLPTSFYSLLQYMWLYVKLNLCCHFLLRFLFHVIVFALPFPTSTLPFLHTPFQLPIYLNLDFVLQLHEWRWSKPVHMEQTIEQFFGTSTQSTFALRYAVNLTTEIHVWKALIFVVVCVFWCQLYHPNSYCINHIKMFRFSPHIIVLVYVFISLQR